MTRVFREGSFAGASDCLLLSQFVDQRDETAFEARLRRHGRLVLNICGKILCDGHEGEDAFQATFLVLVRKAGSLLFKESLAPWISTVAYRTAARAKERRIRQNEREHVEFVFNPAAPDAERNETTRLIHEELHRLPERLRAAIVCCYLDGMTHEVAANQLTWPVGTVRSRLARARARLQDRLARRGLKLADGKLGVLILRSRRLQIPARILGSTFSLALDSRVQTVGVGVAPVSVLGLVKGVLNPMILKKNGNDRCRPPAAGCNLIGAETDKQPSPDAFSRKMAPFLKLIESTIAPGTWWVFDEGGNEVRTEGVSRQVAKKGQTDPQQRTGTMTPFVADRVSVSLNVRHTPEVHEQVAKLFRCLRD
jgi:RNA polymerase sigma factor (sigma-70 family)